MGGGVALGAIGVGMAMTTYLLRIDPFHAMRTERVDPTIGVVLDDVDLRQYDAGKLVTQAKIGHVSIRRDRQELTMEGIRDGVYYGRQGSFNFSADHAEWAAANQSIHVLSGAHVTNRDLDLRTAAFEFQAQESTLVVPGRVVGRVFDGQIVGRDLQYRLTNGTLHAIVESWQGTLKGTLPNPQGQERRKWRTMNPCEITQKGDLRVFVKPVLTDGEIIVKADKAEQDVKSDVIVATGNVQYYSIRANVHCEKVVVYDREKRAVLTGSVRMLVKAQDSEKLAVEEIPPYRPVVPDEISKDRPPAPLNPGADQKALDDEVHSTKSLRKYPVLVYADRVEYWYKKGERHGIVTGNPQAHQEMSGGRWRQIWAQKGLYDGETEMLKLLGTPGKSDVRVKTSLDDDGICQWAEVSTKEDDDSFHAVGMDGNFTMDPADAPQNPKPSKGGGTGAGTGGGSGTTTGGGGG